MVSNLKHVVDANGEIGIGKTSNGHGLPSTSERVIDTDHEFGLGMPSTSKRGIDANKTNEVVVYSIEKKKIKPSVLSTTQVIELVDTPEMPSTSKRGIDANKTNEVVVYSIEKKKIKPSVLSTTQVIELVDTPEKVKMFDYQTYHAAAATSTSAFYSFVGIQDNDGDEISFSVSVCDGYVGDDGDMKPAARTQCE